MDLRSSETSATIAAPPAVPLLEEIVATLTRRNNQWTSQSVLASPDTKDGRFVLHAFS